MRKILLTIIITLLIASAFAQFSKDNNISLGDKAFRNKDYYEAAHYYRKAAEGLDTTIAVNVPYQAGEKVDKKVKINKSRAYLVYQLAESYRLYENYIEAEGWYARIAGSADEAQYPLARLWHGVCQRATQKFDAAIAELERFNAGYKGDNKYLAIAQKEIANCRFARYQYKNPAAVDVIKAKDGWNADGSSYSVMKYNGNYWFTSSRLIAGDKDRLNRIYAAGNGIVTPEIVVFKEDQDIDDVEYGTPSFDPTGKRLYFTRWYKQGSKITCDIYMIQVGSEGLGAMKKLNSNVNADGHHSKQPFVSADGKQLYFVSNKPGGLGGDDIWVSDLNSDGSPLNATNLGSTINTEFDEQAPYYNAKKQKLIYSSKGFTGLGGFDFFESGNSSGQWSASRNMGYPFNSAKDDLYYFPDDENSNKFYFSSDRESDCCLNIFEGYDRRSILSGSVSDCVTHKPLAGVKVSFIDSLTKKVTGDTITNINGIYTLIGGGGKMYNIRLEKRGYFTKVLPGRPSARTGNDTLFNGDICLQAYQINKPIVIQNVWYDYNEATLRPESKLVLDELATIMLNNPKLLVELAAHTDSKGKDAYNDALSLARAKACVDYIISKGVSESQLYAKGYGERRPVAPNTLPNGKDSPEGRQLNRRTEFTVKKVE
ncbi:OmpA family protein [Mucilaginibacter sp. UR6-1]|uniref:OmpA family protein n=1 Tax=Mucilaginibacter sp. UR6-1 TaxID=1435643 RepID=UPI001E5681EB|nr:OmpA family protein [Mucilaginibacter sp. UR6-1]MCC8408222.1 OmpA family protein [Mucilaginibacter sp. UR6-1]